MSVYMTIEIEKPEIFLHVRINKVIILNKRTFWNESLA